MGDVKHTPGPWHAHRTRLDGHEWFIKSEARNLPPYNWLSRMSLKLDPLVPLGGARYVDARSGTASSDRECCSTAITENEANALLIAKAPELLELLKRARRFMDPEEMDIEYVDHVISSAEGVRHGS